MITNFWHCLYTKYNIFLQVSPYQSALDVWKNRVWKIKLDEFHFLSISNLIFTACVACKNHIKCRLMRGLLIFGHKLSNFVSLPWKLENSYYHIVRARQPQAVPNQSLHGDHQSFWHFSEGYMTFQPCNFQPQVLTPEPRELKSPGLKSLG